jgi:ATP-binding cassette, subfamily B, bacterial CvaB/MchF/RaxB
VSITKKLFSRRRTLRAVLQTEAAECGLACITMIVNFYGGNFKLAELRREFAFSIRGASLKTLMDITNALGFTNRAVTLEISDISSLTLPCILHWDMQHFVVLEHCSRGRYKICDPAHGPMEIDEAELNRHFTGVALELSPKPSFERKPSVEPIQLFALMGEVVGLRSALVKVFALGIALQALAILAPFYNQWVIDQALVTSDRGLLLVLAIGFCLLAIISTAIALVRSLLIAQLGVSLNYQWLANVFAHLIRLPVDFFEKRSLGDISSKFHSVTAIQQTLTVSFIESIVDGVLVVATLIMMLIYSPMLATISLVAAAMYALVRWHLYGKAKTALSELIVHEAKQQTHFLETVRAIHAVKQLNGEGQRKSTWMNFFADQANSDYRGQLVSIAGRTINSLLFGIERVAIVYFAATLILDTKLSIGMMFAFLSYKEQFSSRYSSLVERVFEWRTMQLHGERITDIIYSTPEESGTLALTSNTAPSIQVDDVSFAYSNVDEPVLKDISFKVAAGECVAIVGASGSGKSTLAKILLRMLRPSKGRIIVDGQNLSDIRSHSYRSVVTAVMQDDNLFSGSLAENISFFDPHVEIEELTKVAKMANIYDDIVKMPMGFHSLVGEIGSGLSGGQRQRILLARALYRDPKVLILDEATSHLDSESEAAINQAIKRLDITRIVIAHRPSTIASAERVIHIAEGRIV